MQCIDWRSTGYNAAHKDSDRRSWPRDLVLLPHYFSCSSLPLVPLALFWHMT
ncbi:hypothetical protein FKP32DRAFT_1598174 [Trametes sanguinea]|nr:hypothetical protein FKP32DRAFT_1598174 [Trametes sanguinea]